MKIKGEEIEKDEGGLAWKEGKREREKGGQIITKRENQNIGSKVRAKGTGKVKGEGKSDD